MNAVLFLSRAWGALFCVVVMCCGLVFAQDAGVVVQQQPQVEAVAPAPEEPEPVVSALDAINLVSLDFKDADIRNVLKILSQKAGLNIVPTAEVMGTITIKLTEVPWERALDIILKSNGYGYQKQGNVVLVAKAENMSKIVSEEPLKTEILNLKFLDAQDARRIVFPMLSARGSIAILYNRGQKGWKFGSFKIGKEEVVAGMPAREETGLTGSSVEVAVVTKDATGAAKDVKVASDPSIKSKTLLITDTDSVIDRIKDILPKIDMMPRQVLVEARFMEVNKDKLRDIGFDYGTGTTGAESYSTKTYVPTDKRGTTSLSQMAGTALSSYTTPSNFAAKSTGISGTSPYKAGLDLAFQKLTGTQFEVILRALEEDVKANTLSAPRIVTLDNQEASMLVGYHTPILKSEVDAGDSSSGPTQTQSLDYYQEIGIRLNVVPQISEEGYINMIIHPSITSSSSNVSATNVAGTGATAVTTSVNYPIIDVREAQTQILMKDGETVVIGGLLKEVKTKGYIGIPFLSKIPLLGAFFKRETVDNSKVDLLIFITAHVVRDGDSTPEEIAKLQSRMGFPPAKAKTKAGKPVARNK